MLLVIAGGIAAYKALDLVRRLRERGASVRCVMTKAAAQFVTPMAVGAISGGQVFTELFDRASEHDIGHIRLSREADLVVVAPATADLMAKMAHGLADDLASAVLLATDKLVLVAPAMNPAMWSNAATKRNVATLLADGIAFVGPNAGEMAESGEAGTGRMAEPLEIVAAIQTMFEDNPKPLAGLSAVVTSGPTHEPIDPVRYIANRSSGRQGHAIAAALARAGASVTLVSGPVSVPDPRGVDTVHVETARQMLAAVEQALPADIAVMVAAVADWRTVGEAAEKMKKQAGSGPPMLELTENPDILRTVGHHEARPRLVVGFAAETEKVEAHARAKLERKGADWIVANDVSPETGIMGGDRNAVKLLTRDGVETWPDLPKEEVATRLVQRIGQALAADG
ncbi:MAG: bifunctional phosphopantothenoylcysteine decarboxylase/phosphopantothenate--cysteine ligase CoaBC [Pseudomonadota bacterium]|nr:bifunctional phosphopantothenoylcysteine decarboxylase/phosphopantothenate--cysteine ligase CoaBC [Pseudomonadota bacterium]